MESILRELKERLHEIHDIRAAAALLEWDQATYMPAGAAAARARQIGTLRRLEHEKLVDPAVGKLLDKLGSYEERLPYDSDEASLIRVTRRDYEKAVRIPAAFMEELHSHTSASYQAWTVARPADDWATMVPYLEKNVELAHRFADFFPGYERVADPLIDFFAEEGFTVSNIETLFKGLRERLVPMVKRIATRPVPDDTFFHQHFDETSQLAFGLEVIQRLGYDLRRGRQDQTHHPFTTAISLDDVRITNRVQDSDLREALFSTLHEAGHALYEQGISRNLAGTPLARGASAGAHEGQARLWENLVGRSWEFWSFFYPKLQSVFAEQLGEVPLDLFYRAVNKVQPSLIRTAADEVTYNLHIIMRFELEQDLLEGRLVVRDVAEAWREGFAATMGIVPPNHREGILQDVHWYGFVLGPTYQNYTLGNIMSAQLFDAALQDKPEIKSCIAEGEFSPLYNWLRERVYQHGRKFSAPKLIERATGKPLNIKPYINYLQRKFGELYECDW